MVKILRKFKVENSDQLTKLNILNHFIHAKNKKIFMKVKYLPVSKIIIRKIT